MNKIVVLTTTFGLGLALSGCSSYGTVARAPSAPAARTVPAASVSLSAAHVAMIQAYYGRPNASNGRGRGRNRGLPPGIAKNLARGKPMPPGIAKQYLPADLVTRLPSAPSGLEYLVVAGKLLLVDIATQVVREVLLESVFG